MSEVNIQTAPPVANTFDHYLSVLSNSLSYVEDDSFQWSDVMAILIIQLKNTDSLNKARRESHATQIQITSESNPTPGASKTEDFFPTLTMNSSFKSWRIALPARIHKKNIALLSETESDDTSWQSDSIQIRRRLLNERVDNPGNPALQICYGNDLMPIRELLQVDDYLVIVKRRLASTYEVFGVKSDIDLGSGKRMVKSSRTDSDSTVFDLSQLIAGIDDGNGAQTDSDVMNRVSGGENVLLYGVPGAGKSWTIQNEYCLGIPEDQIERLVFHPDYTYSDFVGQILPVSENDGIRYKFTEGPFTRILMRAQKAPQKQFYLIIEEINRGNAPAIFGDIFQLLDRAEGAIDGVGPKGTSQYGITNADVADKVYEDPNHFVRIPSNMSILATMNTADQNVFTLDTAFQRRWHMRMVENSFDNHPFADNPILDTGISWKNFCLAINQEILLKSAGMTSSEDKRLGAYFVSADDLIRDPQEDNENADPRSRMAAKRHNSLFAEKVIKYLWDDAFKYYRGDIFEISNYNSLEAIIKQFMQKPGAERLLIFKEEIRNRINNPIQ